jgi:SAM-dependent methyltransferase
VGQVTAEYWDQWFGDIGASQVRQRVFTEGFGLPPEVGPSNMVPLDGLHEIAAALALSPHGVLVDLACGRGGPGMWIARETGAALIGVDMSAEAIRQATDRRALFGLQDSARFAVGRLEETGLADGIADAVLCVDAFQFASDGATAAVEIRRILRPGGRVVLTSWEAVEPGDERLGSRIRNLDLAASLTAGGFAQVTSIEHADWHQVALSFWQHVMTIDPGEDPALISLHAEGERSLPHHDCMRRVMATAVAA